MKNSHTFAICAYQESPYLEYCIQSLMTQTKKSNIILCTSTPGAFLDNIAEKYKIPMYIREGQSDIRDDWNFAYAKADTEYVTIAHQDDIYHKKYVEEMYRYFEKYPDTILAMTDYKIVNDRNKARGDISLIIKQILKLPLRLSCLADKKVMKLGVQSLGNAICCPSVCYHKSLIQKQRENGETGNQTLLFQSDMKYALDWDTFYQLAHLKGRFTYVPKMLFYYRMHDGTTTKKCLKDHRKTEEEMQMFEKFWPGWLVKIIMKVYRISYKSYEE